MSIRRVCPTRHAGRLVAGTVLLAVVAATLVAPRPGWAEDRPAGLAPGIVVTMVETKLLFGLSSADGNGVSEQEWANFLATEVTPRFPDGLTAIAAYGQVKGEAHGAAAVVQEICGWC